MSRAWEPCPGRRLVARPGQVLQIPARRIKAASPAPPLGFGLKVGGLGFPQEQGKMLGINRLNINS